MKREGQTPEGVESPSGNGRKEEFYVSGSGLVGVPASRANEIPKVIIEHHRLEAERARELVYLLRVI